MSLLIRKLQRYGLVQGNQEKPHSNTNEKYYLQAEGTRQRSSFWDWGVSRIEELDWLRQVARWITVRLYFLIPSDLLLSSLWIKSTQKSVRENQIGKINVGWLYKTECKRKVNVSRDTSCISRMFSSSSGLWWGGSSSHSFQMSRKKYDLSPSRLFLPF